MNKSNYTIYNVLFGEDAHASELLDILDLDRAMFGRYRDCFLNDTGTKIIVLTRCGGVNRADYDNIFANMRNHPHFISDTDDPTDETYCYFVFEVPVLYRHNVKDFINEKSFRMIGEKFNDEQKLLKNNDPGAIERAKTITSLMEEQIKEKENGGVIIMGDFDWKITNKGDM